MHELPRAGLRRSECTLPAAGQTHGPTDESRAGVLSMGYVIGLDIGTTYTAAAVAHEDGRPEVVQLGSRAAVVPSVVFLHEAGVLTGDAALRRGLTAPDRLAREFKRRLGDPAPLLLGGTPLSADALFARLLRFAVDLAAEREGAAPERVAVCHPANWGPYKLELLEQACRIAELENVTTITEPEAAAIQYAALERVEPNALVAVYDLGGGTFDAAVLRKNEAGFELLGAPEGIERLGGIDFDEAVVGHVRAAIGEALAELDLDDPGTVVALARLRQECVEAKEALSADVETSIPVVLPGLHTEVRLTRAEFESMIRVPLLETIAALRRALRNAAVEPDDLTAVLLVGGSSRIPMVAEMVGAELGRPVAVDADPKHVVALGAARAVARGETSVSLAPQPVSPVEIGGLVTAQNGIETAAAEQTAVSATPVEEAAPPEQPARPRSAPPPPEPARTRSRRRLLLAGAAVALLAAVGAAAAVLVSSGGEEASAPAPATTQPTTAGSAVTPAEAPRLEWTRLEDAGLAGPDAQRISRLAVSSDGTLAAVGSNGAGETRTAAFWTLRDVDGGPSVEKHLGSAGGSQTAQGVSATAAGSFVAAGFQQVGSGSPSINAAAWLSSGGSWEPVSVGSDEPYQTMNRTAANAAGNILAVGAVAAGFRPGEGPLQTDAAAWLSTDGGASFDRLEDATVAKDAYQVMRGAEAYRDGWVAVGEDGRDAGVWRSGSGVWRQLEGSPDLTAGGQWADLVIVDVHAWLDGLVAVGFVASADGDRDAGVWISPDGESWRLLADEDFGGPGDQQALGVVAGDFGIVAVGCSQCEDDGAQPLVWTSADGDAWTSTRGDELPGAGTPRQLSDVTLAGTTLVAAGWEQPGADPDAAVWLAPLPAAS